VNKGGQSDLVKTKRGESRKRIEDMMFSSVLTKVAEMEKFDAASELAEVKKIQEVRRKKRLFSSKLDKFEHGIRALKSAGASLAQLQIWLKKNSVKASRSTVQRWLNGKI